VHFRVNNDFSDVNNGTALGNPKSSFFHFAGGGQSQSCSPVPNVEEKSKVCLSVNDVNNKD